MPNMPTNFIKHEFTFIYVSIENTWLTVTRVYPA